METIKLSILKYKDKEVGYRLDKGVIKLDVSKDDFDKCGGIDYSDINYIDLIANGKLIASKDEIDSGCFVSQVTDKVEVDKLYNDYIISLGNRLVCDKYVLKENDNSINKGVDVYKLGDSNLVTSFYTTTDYNSIYSSVESLSNSIGLSDIYVEDYGDSATTMLSGVTLHSLDYDNDIDLLMYNVRYLILKLVKALNSELVY